MTLTLHKQHGKEKVETRNMRQNFLKQIVEAKKEEIARSRKKISENELSKIALQPKKGRSFQKALADARPSDVRIIAEIKRASPSKGVFRTDLNAAEMARNYQEGGAVAISVLTDPTFFNGSDMDLKAAHNHSKLPVLRKDFILCRYQILEAAAWGADAVLLIVRILTEDLLKDLLSCCNELGLDALVEVCAPEEIETATLAGAAIIGINNRDLKTFQTDIHKAIKMVSLLEPHQIPVVASGICSRADIEKNLDAGLNNFLVGEHLVRSKNPKECIRALMGMKNQYAS
jgi:indole-3-glycerol phosphate synthase